jgi:acetolactate synthase small subunit
MVTMENEALLKQLGYTPNEALLEQIERIKANTKGFEKIEKHIVDLHEVLKVDDSYVAMSNSHDFFKIKIEAPSPERTQEAMDKVHHFAKKFKVELEKVPGKDTYYILGFEK